MKIITPSLLYFIWYIASSTLISLWIITAGREPLIRIFGSSDNQHLFSTICLLAYFLVLPSNVNKSEMIQGLWNKPLSTIRFSDFTVTPEVCLKTLRWIVIMLFIITTDSQQLQIFSTNPYFTQTLWALLLILNSEKYLKWWRENLKEK